ncbi:Hint domain-containing protein [Pseudoroseicyclus aestuarii]|uniref:Hint domain-containing protein n=1 Tax=Pseudoroseicyclus aestuarii TaxID=1795041 RepID=A0A318SN66_9RHOB|nr:Hint domain-containing protein [Pseudoroseicyclus aestuarii]PYE82253.1 Hint domain-containing protein [Pseudoroseicyclus aestuarii]
MPAFYTPIYDLIELSSISANTLYTAASGGAGDILGVVDTATYSDTDLTNTLGYIGELNETANTHSGSLEIDGITYSIRLPVPDNSGDVVTVTYDGGASQRDLSGNGGSSEIVFIEATPLFGGPVRYFAVVDDSVGDLEGITSIQTLDIDFTPAGNDVEITASGNQNIAPVCHAAGTRLMTPQGEVAIEDLSVGDLVTTVDAGPQPIRLILRREMTFAEAEDAHRPIVIRAGAMGQGLPRRDLAISPQHCIAWPGASGAAGEGALVRAKGLTALRGVRIMRGLRQVTYVTLLLDQHQLLLAEGVPSESFYPGPTALRLLTGPQRRALEALHPGLAADPVGTYGAPVRTRLTRRETERWARTLNSAATADAAPAGA